MPGRVAAQRLREPTLYPYGVNTREGGHEILAVVRPALDSGGQILAPPGNRDPGRPELREIDNDVVNPDPFAPDKDGRYRGVNNLYHDEKSTPNSNRTTPTRINRARIKTGLFHGIMANLPRVVCISGVREKVRGQHGAAGP